MSGTSLHLPITYFVPTLMLTSAWKRGVKAVKKFLDVSPIRPWQAYIASYILTWLEVRSGVAKDGLPH